MKKIWILSSIIVIIILIGIGYYLMPQNEVNPEISEYTGLFDYSNPPITNWNADTHEYKFHQKITGIDNQDVKNLTIDVVFYNEGKLVGVKSNYINETDNGSFDLNFKMKLDCDPDEFYYNVTELNWA